MKITAEPRSDQWNADDFIGGPRTFTVAGVKVGKAEQKYDIELAEGEGRVWRPPLTVLRILLSAWGDEAATWTGRRATLYRDESVRFGSDQVGGIRVSHLSHIDGPLTVNVTASRGRRGKITVQPLPDTPDTARLFALFAEHSLDKDAALELCSQETGRSIESTKDLSAAEVAQIIAALAGDS